MARGGIKSLLFHFYMQCLALNVFLRKNLMKRIAIFASGAGTNAKRIIDYFKKGLGQEAKIRLIVSNNPNAGVLEIAKEEKIETLLVNREFFKSEAFLEKLDNVGIDLIVLAGFLWMIPEQLTRKYHNRIVNIHPALLPKYGGKGMYGTAVHKAVREAEEKESGISIHYVNERYDEGEIIFQAKCSVTDTDTPETIEQKVRKLEHEHYPRVIRDILKSL